ncbi:MAG: hypothetical protein SF162_10725 [bacterium]|nr:hypothetical protein [bacterium]
MIRWNRQEPTEAVPTLGHRDRTFRGVLAGVLPITISVIVLFSVVYLVLDRRHAAQVEACQNAVLFYPGAGVIARADRTITQPFGVIETQIALRSADDPETVEAWYRQAFGRYVREQVQRGGTRATLSIPERDWAFQAEPDGGTSMQLLLYCP